MSMTGTAAPGSVQTHQALCEQSAQSSRTTPTFRLINAKPTCKSKLLRVTGMKVPINNSFCSPFALLLFGWVGGGGIHQTSIDCMTVILIPDQEHPVTNSSHVAKYESSNQKTKVRFIVKVQVSLCLKSQALDFIILSTANTFAFN